ncbi:heme-dependent oxidative N-demethylase family protein [Kineococcus arenarius]|uniref:heme-dependent oxidative N-demethylase family protein n=1 Tax=unclassified Kineococcus TaxID=2621656 RepID=UPI003D7CBD37
MSDLTRLPWPFSPGERAFRYAVNVEPARRRVDTPAGHWGSHVVDLGDDYLEQMALRREVLARDPGRRQVLPHMEPACWDMLLFLVRELAASYPETMHLRQDGQDLHWRNDLLGIERRFTLGDRTGLGVDPLTFIGCQVPDDLLMVSDRGGRLWFDAALVTWAAAWSVKFDVGMSLEEVHGPVPRLNEDGTTSRATQFMRRLTPDVVYRRVNWTFSAHGSDLRDISLETKPQWDADIPRLIADGDYGRLHLRIELEHLTRLPLSGALTFNIRTYTAPLAEIATIPEWRDQLAAVVEELPQDIADYKGIGAYRHQAVEWLRHASADHLVTT